MMHLSNDQLIALAELESEMSIPDDDQLLQLEHLKDCRACYEKYCVYAVMADVMSESGSYSWMLREAPAAAKEAVHAVSGRIFAVLYVIRNSVRDAAGLVIDQIDQELAALQFAPVLNAAARGADGKASDTLLLEEFNDEKTYIQYDQAGRQLTIQVNLKYLETDKVSAHLKFDNGTRIEIPMKIERKLATGVLSDVPDGNFKIYLEEL